MLGYIFPTEFFVIFLTIFWETTIIVFPIALSVRIVSNFERIVRYIIMKSNFMKFICVSIGWRQDDTVKYNITYFT